MLSVVCDNDLGKVNNYNLDPSQGKDKGGVISKSDKREVIEVGGRR